MGSIITLRLIFIISTLITSMSPSYFLAQPCAKIDFIIGWYSTLQRYPACESFHNGTDPGKTVAVLGNFNGYGEQVGTALDLSFGMGLWLALFMHAFGVEIYVSALGNQDVTVVRPILLILGSLLLAPTNTTRVRTPS
jgi:hypothetical protein